LDGKSVAKQVNGLENRPLSLYLFALIDEPTLGAVVNLAISQLHYLELEQCTLSPAVVPALAQILQRGSLKGMLR
jgi:hypothetical protein